MTLSVPCDSHFVKTSGLRWRSSDGNGRHSLGLGVSGHSRFSPFWHPQKRHHQFHGTRHKTLTDWTRQMPSQVRRWLSHRAIVLVADSSFAALELLEALRQLSTQFHVVTRLRLDAALYHPAPERKSETDGSSSQSW